MTNVQNENKIEQMNKELSDIRENLNFLQRLSTNMLKISQQLNPGYDSGCSGFHAQIKDDLIVFYGQLSYKKISDYGYFYKYEDLMDYKIGKSACSKIQGT